MSMAVLHCPLLSDIYENLPLFDRLVIDTETEITRSDFMENSLRGKVKSAALFYICERFLHENLPPFVSETDRKKEICLC